MQVISDTAYSVAGRGALPFHFFFCCCLVAHLVWERIGHALRTHWRRIRDTLATHWERIRDTLRTY